MRANNYEIVIGVEKNDGTCNVIKHFIGNRNQCMIKLYTFAENLAKDLDVSTVHVRECKDSTYTHSKFRLDSIKMKNHHYMVDVFESDITILE